MSWYVILGYAALAVFVFDALFLGAWLVPQSIRDRRRARRRLEQVKQYGYGYTRIRRYTH